MDAEPLFLGVMATLRASGFTADSVRADFEKAFVAAFPPKVIREPFATMCAFEGRYGRLINTDRNRADWWNKMRATAEAHGVLSERQTKTVNDIAVAVSGNTIL